MSLSVCLEAETVTFGSLAGQSHLDTTAVQQSHLESWFVCHLTDKSLLEAT
tara:strand:- start:1478 stop:1630 length:153 start_codon:yes stop_codon:yes gene_type:complete